jgi:hypothetical protein
LAVRTESTDATRPRRNRAARASFFFGLLGAAAVPAAVAVAEWHERLELVDAGYAVPGAFLLSVLALWLARRARRGLERTLGRIGGQRTARAGRIFGWLGVYIAVTAAVALGVYAYLEYLAAD